MMSPVSRRRRTAGLTLIELMVTLSILGVIAALAAPSFTGFVARSKLRGAAHEVFADLQYARSESVQKNRVFQVEFSAAGYEIWRMDRTTPANHDASTAANPNPVKAVYWSDSGTNLSSGSTMVITYNPVRASATIANGPLVIAHSATSGTLQVTVSTTGRAELCSPLASVPGVVSC
jgi:type II secretion system protein H